MSDYFVERFMEILPERKKMKRTMEINDHRDSYPQKNKSMREQKKNEENDGHQQSWILPNGISGHGYLTSCVIFYFEISRIFDYPVWLDQVNIL